ncbi:hypothetical protein CRYPA_1834 [uncultured Candidatus Thioglobus sp.]|nr:hypothetical protein CRYPA_1834 [uncultured Candidatus Thioglobus sp.]
MSKPIVITVVESMLFPNYGNLYQDKGFEEHMVNSIRKAISLIKKRPAAVIVVEFFYAYSTNYSGIYKSNLEVLLVSLIKYSPNTKVIVLAKKKEMQFINVLNAVDYLLHGVLQLPTSSSQMKALLDNI